MATPGSLSIDVFLSKLQELSAGLFYISESDYPLEPVHYEHPTPNHTLTNPEVLQLTDQPAEVQVEVVELPFFFRNMTKDTPEADDDSRKIAQRFRDLQVFLEQNLQNVKVYRIGRREIQAFILGKLNEAHIAGLKTTVIET